MHQTHLLTRLAIVHSEIKTNQQEPGTSMRMQAQGSGSSTRNLGLFCFCCFVVIYIQSQSLFFHSEADLLVGVRVKKQGPYSGDHSQGLEVTTAHPVVEPCPGIGLGLHPRHLSNCPGNSPSLQPTSANCGVQMGETNVPFLSRKSISHPPHIHKHLLQNLR